MHGKLLQAAGRWRQRQPRAGSRTRMQTQAGLRRTTVLEHLHPRELMVIAIMEALIALVMRMMCVEAVGLITAAGCFLLLPLVLLGRGAGAARA